MKDNIKTYIFTGFLDAGKTTYIQDALANDYFYRHGRTLLLVFENGETEYDAGLLKAKRTDPAVYGEEPDAAEDITAFCLKAIETYRPDRIWVEDNLMLAGLSGRFPPCMDLQAKTVLIDASTLPLYFRNLRQKLRDAVAGSRLVLFNRAPDKEILTPYANDFRLMEPNTAYLWESPQGYHEKAFGVVLTFDISEPHIEIGNTDFASFFLDALEHPEHYDGKEITFNGRIRLPEDGGNETFYIGRTLMTCCPADMQFYSLVCKNDGRVTPSDSAWVRLTAAGSIGHDEYGRRRLELLPLTLAPGPR